MALFIIIHGSNMKNRHFKSYFSFMGWWAGPGTGVYILHVKGAAWFSSSNTCTIIFLELEFLRINSIFFFFFVSGATKVSLVFPNSEIDIIQKCSNSCIQLSLSILNSQWSQIRNYSRQLVKPVKGSLSTGVYVHIWIPVSQLCRSLRSIMSRGQSYI